LDLRFYDGTDRSWYDTLDLPTKALHVVSGTVIQLLKRGLLAKISIPLFSAVHELSPSDVAMYVYCTLPTGAVLVDDNWRSTHPQIFI
jgi:hypothetical protein